MMRSSLGVDRRLRVVVPANHAPACWQRLPRVRASSSVTCCCSAGGASVGDNSDGAGRGQGRRRGGNVRREV
jgi:hypothetical protein